MITDKPLVSVLMTAYNREKYIAEAIESVLASTYENFELIIVDDESKDATVSIAKKYEEQDRRVKIYVNEENLGDYPNRNKAASYANGKYLKYVDADDLIYPHGLEILVEMMEQFPDAGWGLCSLEQNKERAFPFVLSPTEAYLYHYTGQGLFHKAPLSSIIKRNVFEEQKGFRNIRMAGDFEMWHRLGLSYHVVLMPHGIVWYREHGDQEVKDYNQYITVYEKIKLDYLKNEKQPLSGDAIKKIFSMEKRKKLKEFFRSFFSLNIKTAKAALIKLRYTN